MNRVLRTLPLLLALSMVPCPALAWEWELELGLFNRFTVKDDEVERRLRYFTATNLNRFDLPSYLAPKNSGLYYSFVVHANVFIEPTEWFGVGLTLDSGELCPSCPVPVEGATTYLGIPVLSTEDQRAFTANGRSISEEAEDTLFIRQVFLQFTAPETGWFILRGGRLATDIGNGLVYNDFGLGGKVLMDLERLRDTPLRLSAQAVLPTRSWTSGLSSPLVELRADYVFSSFLSLVEYVGLTVSYFHDADDNFGTLLEPGIQELTVKMLSGNNTPLIHEAVAGLLGTPLGSEAHIAWIGLSGNKLLGDLQLSGTVLLEVGHLRVDNPRQVLAQASQKLDWQKISEPVRQTITKTLEQFVPTDKTLEKDTLGWAMDLQAQYLITEELSLGGFFLYLSGNDNLFLGQKDDTYNSFLSVVPHITHTNLFFSGGMNETFSGRQAATAGINGRGVIAFGPNLAWQITDQISTGVKTAALFSQVESIYGGNFYGFEADVEGSWEIFEFLRISLEYDLLAAQDFFARDAVIHKLMIGLDLTYER